MAWINEAHTEWHTVNGWNAVCPLDCGAGEPDPYEDWCPYHDGGEQDAISGICTCATVQVPELTEARDWNEVPF